MNDHCSNEMKWVELEIDSHGRKAFISSCDSTAKGFKQDELCFSELFCYQMSSESCETATVSYKNCHTLKQKGFSKSLLLLLILVGTVHVHNIHI